MKEVKKLDNLKGLTLVDFWAPWCGPCKAVSPILESVKIDSVEIVKFNIDEHNVPDELGIRSIPALVMFKDDKEIDRLIGVQPKTAIEKMIKKHVKGVK